MKKITSQLAILFILILTTAAISCNNNSTKSKNEPSEADSYYNKISGEVFKLKADTLGIKVFDVNCKPGDSIPMHSYPDNVLYAIEPGTVEYTNEDGTKSISEFKTGMVYIRPAGSAIAKNIGNTTFKGVLFHILRPNVIEKIQKPELDAPIVEPNFYHVLADSMNIRVVMASYEAGKTSKTHDHPDHAAYVIKGGKSQIIEKDGNKIDNLLVSGTVGIFSGSEHSFKNNDTTDWKVLMVEVNRKRQ